MGLAALPTMRVEIGLSGPTVGPLIWHIGDLVRGKIGTFQIGPPDVWDDITPYVRSWSFQRGSTRTDALGVHYDPGTCTLDLNNGDRRFDPSNADGPYASAGVTQLLPMVRVRLSARWAGVWYRLWTGYADSWLPDYNAPTWSTVKLSATDAFKVFNGQDRTALAIPVGAGELSGARIARILDNLGWLTDDRVIAAGDTAMQATTLAGNGLNELQLAQDTEAGELYVDASGNVVFRNRHAILTNYRSNTPQAVFGDGGIAVWEIPYTTLTVDNDDSSMANYISVTRVGGTEQVAQDAASQARFMKKTYARTDLLLLTDAEALNYGRSLLSQAKDPELKFSEIGFNVPRQFTADAVWPALLNLDLGDRVTVRRRLPDGTRVPPGVLMETLQDDFTFGSAPDATRWPLQTPGLCTLSNGWASISSGTPAAYIALQSASAYTMSGSRLVAKVVPATPSGNLSQQTYMSVGIDSNNWVGLLRDGASLYGVTSVAGVNTNTLIGAYNAATMAWWRIRHDGTGFFTAFSANGISWTEQAISVPSWAVTATMCATFLSGKWDAGDAPAVMTIDNVNLLPGKIVERDVFVRNIGMTSNGEDWKTTLAFQSATRQQFFTIGHPTLGRIGFNALAY